MKPLANWPAAWATAPYKRNQILVHDSKRSYPKSSLSFYRQLCICVVQVFGSSSNICFVTHEAFGKLTSSVGYCTLEKISFSLMTFKKKLTQNRRCLSSGMFSAGDWASSPRRPLATLPAAWANAPFKKSISRLWLMRKVSPRIVVLFPQACFQIVQLVSQFRHRRNGRWRHEQHGQPIDAK